ncbi:3'-5' exonuclease, partial [Vibrio makurazakiensis]
LIARRLIQDSPTHKLGDLIRFKNIDNDGVFHRALADSEMTAKLWLVMLQELEENNNIAQPTFSLMQKIAKTSKSAVPKLLSNYG